MYALIGNVVDFTFSKRNLRQKITIWSDMYDNGIQFQRYF